MIGELWQFIIVCPLVFLAGFVDAIAGGGGLISLPAYMICGIPVHYAIGTNKLSASMGAVVSTWKYARNGYIPWKLAAGSVVCALVGSTLGAKLALLLSDYVFKIVMLIVLPLTALYVMRGKALQSDVEREQYPIKKVALISMAAALVIGVYDGFYGPGTGTFLLLILTGVAHLELHQANGVSKLINLATNIAAVTVYLTSGKVLMALGLTAGLFSIVGSYAGARFFSAKGVKSVKPIILVVLAIFFVRVLSELLA